MKRYHQNFNRMKKLGILNVTEHAKIENEPYMPLSIDRLGPNRIAIAHNYIQNGDVMADPDMEIEINLENETVEALTFQNSGLGIFQNVYTYDNQGNKKGVYRKLKQQLNMFLEQWLKNLKKQGFKLENQPSI